MEELQKAEDRQANIITPIDKAMVKHEIGEHDKELIRNNMTEFYNKAIEWEAKIKAIKVTSALQVADMKMARTARLAVRQVRVDAEHKKDYLKRSALDYSNAVQSVYNFIKGICEPLETYALEQEEFAERLEAKQRRETRDARLKLLGPYIDHAKLNGIDLSTVSEELFLDILDAAMEAKRVYDETERKLQEEALEKRKKDEEERERLKNELAEAKKTVQSQGNVISYLKKELVEDKKPPAAIRQGQVISQKELELHGLYHINHELRDIFEPEGTANIASVAKAMDAIRMLYTNITKYITELEKK